MSDRKRVRKACGALRQVGSSAHVWVVEGRRGTGPLTEARVLGVTIRPDHPRWSAVVRALAGSRGASALELSTLEAVREWALQEYLVLGVNQHAGPAYPVEVLLRHYNAWAKDNRRKRCPLALFRQHVVAIGGRMTSKGGVLGLVPKDVVLGDARLIGGA